MKVSSSRARKDLTKHYEKNIIKRKRSPQAGLRHLRNDIQTMETYINETQLEPNVRIVFDSILERLKYSLPEIQLNS